MAGKSRKSHSTTSARRSRSAARASVSAGAGASTAKPSVEELDPIINGDLRATLRRDIVSCVLQPGQRLKFEELRARYDAGIGSLREALMQLAADGLVVAESNRGFCVAPVSVADLEDITELRVDIEKKALAKSIQHGDDAWEAGIVAALHMLIKSQPELTPSHTRNREVWEQRHRGFHDALVAACPSQWLLRFRQVLFVQSQRYRALSLLQSQQPGRANDHRALVEVVLSRDVARATAAMEDHIRHTANNVREWLSVHGHAAGTTEFAQDHEARRTAAQAAHGI